VLTCTFCPLDRVNEPRQWSRVSAVGLSQADLVHGLGLCLRARCSHEVHPADRRDHPLVAMSSHQQGPLYSPPHPYPPYKYDEPIDPQIPRNYPESFEANAGASHPLSQQPPQQVQVQVGGQARNNSSSEPKQRLRKACDSCSVRKVKVSPVPPPDAPPGPILTDDEV
jgi:hypothetical protein